MRLPRSLLIFSGSTVLADNCRVIRKPAKRATHRRPHLDPIGGDPLTYFDDLFARAVHAATGLEMAGEELLVAGKGAVNLEKVFNSRLGRGRKDDMLCECWMKEPMPEGPGKGWKAEDYLEELESEYEEWHGWDGESSLQKRSTLEELGMEDVAAVPS